MFEIDKDCSQNRERLEALWHKKTDNELDNRGKQLEDAELSKAKIISGVTVSKTLAKSFFLAFIVAFAFSASSIKPGMEEMVPPEVKSIPTVVSLPSVPTKPVEEPKSISVTRSTITGIVDSNSLTAAQYWTMILRSDYGNANQGEFDLVVPDGSALSRVTLWVNGKPQEAAFNATQRVVAAYNEVVRRARDPVLVTWTDSSRVHIKVYPVASNKDFKFRVGMTSPINIDPSGHMKMTVPYVENANIRFDSSQDIHLESDVPLAANRHDVSSTPNKSGFIVKGNIAAERLKALALTGIPGSRFTSFATRATHSNPPAVIIAKLTQAPFGKKLFLEKSLEVPPSIPYIESEDVAHRVSSLWALSEIEKLAGNGDRSLACDLAMTYRIISPVSGATVLERDSDYENFGLHRQLYRTSNYMSESSLARADKEAPYLQATTNGSIGPQGDDATAIMGVNTTGTLRVNSLANIDSWKVFSGPVMESITASARDANLFDPLPDANTMGGTSIVSFVLIFAFVVIPVLAFSAFTFLGATTLFVLAVKNRSNPGLRNKLIVFSSLWLILAMVSPAASQFLLVPAVAALLVPRCRALFGSQ